jgi:pseudo-rSAM protein
MSDPINLYVVNVDRQDREDALFSSWIRDIEKYKIGFVYSGDENRGKPYSFPPILNLRHEIEESQIDENRYYSSINTADCLNEISFFLGGKELPDKEKDYFKQILYPYSRKSFMSYSRLCSFLNISNITHLRQINIICSDLLRFPNFENLLRLLASYGTSITYYLEGDNTTVIEKIAQILKGSKFSLKLYFKDVHSFINVQNAVIEYDIDYNWVFLIENENDLLHCEKIVGEYNLDQTDIWPVLTDTNIDFFKENIFTSFDDIEDALLTKQNIFCNQSINSNCWGHLFVLPDNNVYGNLNKKPLGTTEEDATKLIRSEIKNPESSWKCTREKVVPCKDCIYRNLCPPPSNYEFYLDKFNLCTIE